MWLLPLDPYCSKYTYLSLLQCYISQIPIHITPFEWGAIFCINQKHKSSTWKWVWALNHNILMRIFFTLASWKHEKYLIQVIGLNKTLIMSVILHIKLVSFRYNGLAQLYCWWIMPPFSSPFSPISSRWLLFRNKNFVLNFI